ncbi:hypothetical protein ANCDUO_25980, partial [Ancylostoma duodenale]
MESIVALNKLVSRANDSQLRSILRQVLLKIRPCFEKVLFNRRVRCSTRCVLQSLWR